MNRRAGLLTVLALLCAGCSREPAATAQVGVSNQVGATAAVRPEKPRFDPAAIAAMKKQLLAEPKIKDVLFQGDPMLVDWQVGVYDDGSSRVGYAGYVCLRLREKGLVDEDTDVRIVDIRKVSQGVGFRDASLGHIDCATEQDLGT
ncbi:MAG: hypothetical protein ABIS51_05775 [Sphingomonas sp.]